MSSGAGVERVKGTLRRYAPPRVRRLGARVLAARREEDRGNLSKQVARLRRRVTELEQEVQESRRLNRRIAELTDVVQQLLLPADGRDDAFLRERLAGFDTERRVTVSTDRSAKAE